MADDTQDAEASDDSSWGNVFTKDGATYIKVDISEIRPRDNDEVETPKEAKLLSNPKSTAKLIDDVIQKDALITKAPAAMKKMRVM